MPAHRPVIGVPACRRLLEARYFHVAGEKYLSAILDASDCIPVVIPALGEAMEMEVLLDRLDGLLLTGSPSMVEPHHYDGPASEPGTHHDPHRDETTFALIPAVIDAGLPVFGICRGFQEMNVAFGGTLHQKVHETGVHDDHREDPDDPLELQYGPAHDVNLTAGGSLREITGKDSLTVNSVHHQGVDRLGRHLVVQAVADDGLVEAFTVEDAPGFTLAVQWHPEWKPLENEDSTAIFRAFGNAARTSARRRHHA